jgi:hypothetical protein
MKPEFVYKSLLLGLILVAGTARSAQPQPAAATPAPAAVPEKSVFIETPGYGRDPFFPNSKRHQKAAPVKTIVAGELPSTIVLKGLSGTAQKRLAVINNYTLAEGEETEIRAGGQLFRVRCVEIRERSVMVSVNGMEPKELKMRAGW